jgi:hypothetical protein
MEKAEVEQSCNILNRPQNENGLLSLPQGIDQIQRAVSPGTLSNFSINDYGRLIEERTGPSTTLKPLKENLKAFWIRNKGLALVIASQVFNCLMNVAITILEIEGNGGKGFHPLQVKIQ